MHRLGSKVFHLGKKTGKCGRRRRRGLWHGLGLVFSEARQARGVVQRNGAGAAAPRRVQPACRARVRLSARFALRFPGTKVIPAPKGGRSPWD